MQTTMKVLYPVSFLRQINMAIDTEEYQHITIEDVENEIENGSLFSYLRKELNDHIDFSLWKLDMEAALTNALYDILVVYKGKERRKFGIENSGLCLLVAWTLEVIARNTDNQKNVEISFNSFQV